MFDTDSCPFDDPPCFREELTLADAAHNLFMGSQSLIWAFENGLITEDEYDAAEAQFDITQNRLYGILHLDLDAEFSQLTTD